MIDLHERLPAALRRTTLIREQLGFALNRLGRRAEALAVLEAVLAEQGASSETCGLIGRIYKDQWTDASRRGETRLATGFLDKAIAMYRQGFEADIRDAYPGINLVTLLAMKGDPEALAEQAELLPVVRFAVRRRLKTTRPDYWDLATLLELAVLAGRPDEVERCLSDALAAVREPWEPLTTANNLKMIRDAQAARGADVAWLSDVIETLERTGS
jgi:tetratricopeptide (TPR) repeat protein